MRCTHIETRRDKHTHAGYNALAGIKSAHHLVIPPFNCSSSKRTTACSILALNHSLPCFPMIQATNTVMHGVNNAGQPEVEQEVQEAKKEGK